MKIIKLREAIRPHAPKLLVYGPSGIGKTTLIGSLPGRVLILSAEAGLLSLAFAVGDDRFEVAEIATVDDLVASHKFLSTSSHGYDWVALDSVSEIAEVVLAHEKKKSADPRQAYGAVIDRVTAAMRAFRDLEIGVYFSAKQSTTKDDSTGKITHGIAMPGSKLGEAVPYLFDEVFRLVAIDEDAGDGKRVSTRYLQTAADSSSVAKDRSGALDPLEPADLGAIVAKIQAAVTNNAGGAASLADDKE